MVLLKLYWSFLLIGFSSFGGLSMIPQISDQVITNGWMTVSRKLQYNLSNTMVSYLRFS